MMATVSCLENRTNYCLLLFFAIGLSILPSASSQNCNSYFGEPLIEISSTPPSNILPIGASINLTCTAWQTDVRARTDPKTRPHRIEWFDPQGKRIGDECRVESSAAIRMNCTLMVSALTEEKFGNYICKASNYDNHCSSKRFPIKRQVIKKPEIVIIMAPLNQSVAIGSTASFNCSATGNPKPTITWKKDNDSDFIQPVVETDDEKTLSQLIITRVTSKDYGKYVCVANNSAGVETSKAAELYQVELEITDVATTFPGTEAPSLSRMPQNGAYKIIAITLPGITVAMLIVAFWWHCKQRCPYSKTHSGKDPEPSVTYNRSLPEENQEESTYDVTNTPSYALTIASPENEEVQISFPNSEENPLLDTLRVELPPKKHPQARPMLPTPEDDDASHKMKWDSEEQNLMCSPVLQSGSQGHDFESSQSGNHYEMEGGCDAPDRRESTQRFPPPRRPPKHGIEMKDNTEGSQTRNLERSETSTVHKLKSHFDNQERESSVQVSLALPRPPKPRKEVEASRKHDGMCDIKFSEIEEDGEILLERLKIHDKVLGEGEYGIVYKGSYRRNNGKVIDVAVKQLKDNTSATDKFALLTEIRMLKQAGRHPNIVNLVGASTQGEIILLVTELVPAGSLETMLNCKRKAGMDGNYKNINCELNERELVNIALQVATGMQHLERKKCIHGDLAARNVFIDNNKVARVGDFGLARDISDRGIYTKTSNGKVPWRWLSLESLRYQVYTTQSDVWSFGILLWEIVTYGGLPYPDITAPAALINFLSLGNRMTCPDHCWEELDELMHSCWRENPLMRPTFTEITKQLKYLLREIKKTYANVKDDDIDAE